MTKTAYPQVYSWGLSPGSPSLFCRQSWYKEKGSNQHKYVKVYKNKENTISYFQKYVFNSPNETTLNNNLFSDPNESHDKPENVIINGKENIFQP